MFDNGRQFVDTSGNAVHAHDGGILRVGDFYYWFGECRNPDFTFQSVRVYRSADLLTWELRGHALTPESSPELGSAKLERPKVLYNRATGRYVMWMHKENGVDYTEARVAVAVADTVDGRYTYLGSFRPLGYLSRDMTLFQDEDGAGYLISAAHEDNRDLHLYRLSADYLSVVGRARVLFAGLQREAPALFKRGGVYFLLTSACTWWEHNQQRYATASSLTGEWGPLRDVGDATAYDSQTAFVLAVHGSQTTSHLYLADRWAPARGGAFNDSGYVWLPLRFPTPDTMVMRWHPRISIDAAAGVVAGA